MNPGWLLLIIPGSMVLGGVITLYALLAYAAKDAFK